MSNGKTKVHTVKVVRHEGEVSIPKEMDLITLRGIIDKMITKAETVIAVSQEIPCIIWDGALGLRKALEEVLGYALQEEIQIKTFFGTQKIKPKIFHIPVSVTETTAVPWGRFGLPGMEDAYIETGITQNDEGRVIFRMNSECKGKFEAQVKKIMERAHYYATHESIYKGKAILVDITDEDGETQDMVIPKFMDLTPEPVIFSQGVQAAIDANILTHIRYTEVVRDWAVCPLKRTVLLAGGYGTGKTLTAKVVAIEAVRNGWTFLYIRKVKDVVQGIGIAKGFQPCVLFCEDIDRAAGLERTDDVDAILRELDGITSKNVAILTVFTTNHPDKIHPAMKRKGRIDRAIEVKRPDADAAIRLMRHYGRDLIAESEDLRDAGDILAGQTPATIREAVESAKLVAITRGKGMLDEITAYDVAQSAKDILGEMKYFPQEDPDAKPEEIHPIERFGLGFGRAVGKAIEKNSHRIDTGEFLDHEYMKEKA